MKQLAVLYHKNCLDGFGAAWSAWKKFGASANYIPVEHQTPPPAIKNKDIYILDFSYPAETLGKLSKANRGLTVIDHHVSAEKDVKSAPDFIYDLKHSAAVLAWRRFHPKLPIPTLLRYIEDVDLWRLKMKDTKAVVSFLETEKMDFSVWNKIAGRFEDPDIKACIANGKAILKYKETAIAKLMDYAEPAILEGYQAMTLNSPVLNSELGDRLLRKYKVPLAILWSRKKGKINVSLRAQKDVNAAEIAKRFGGGGHKSAAGFSIQTKKPEELSLPWKYTTPI